MTRFCFILLSILLLHGCVTPSVDRPVWIRVTDPPGKVVAGVEAHDRQMSAVPWSFEGVQPEVYSDQHGHYRVVWFKKDPLRDSYWYSWYEVTADGQTIRGGASAIPSDLAFPSIEDIRGW